MPELHINPHRITQITARNRVIQAIYIGAQLVWEAVRSCFGSGMWIPAKPWLYKEGWKKTKGRG